MIFYLLITQVLILRKIKWGKKWGKNKGVQEIGYFTFQINSVVNLFYISKKWGKKWGKTLYLINFEIKVIK